MTRGFWLAVAASIGLAAFALTAPALAASAPSPPRYDHVIVIVEENKDYDQILDPAVAPHIAHLAQAYGNAVNFWGEVHPSEANYMALLGGDTFGVHDDDAFYCKPGLVDPQCPGAGKPGYVDHTAHAPHLGDQLAAAGLTWKGYYENLPAPGSLVPNYSDPAHPALTPGSALYASKHSGFLNFASVQADPERAQHIVGFDQFEADLAADALPSFALLIPNQCNEMHGVRAPWISHDCDGIDLLALIRRGDAEVDALVRKIQASEAWRGAGNFAIVVTFDEGSGGSRGGCCAVTPDAPSNFGGGHIPTIVITNHGPRGLSDAVAYNHYSLLRTLEDVFGLPQHLRHAAETDKGVVDMTPLFAVQP